MNYRTMVNRKLIAALVCCIGLIAGMAAAAQLAPVYAGSHSTQGSKDVGSITVNNKTTYYDDVVSQISKSKSFFNYISGCSPASCSING